MTDDKIQHLVLETLEVQMKNINSLRETNGFLIEAVLTLQKRMGAIEADNVYLSSLVAQQAGLEFTFH